jgi:hypothetical protein
MFLLDSYLNSIQEEDPIGIKVIDKHWFPIEEDKTNRADFYIQQAFHA